MQASSYPLCVFGSLSSLSRICAWRGDTDEALRLAIARIDKAASKGVIHKNTAARKKSRLVKRVGRISTEA